MVQMFIILKSDQVCVKTKVNTIDKEKLHVIH